MSTFAWSYKSNVSGSKPPKENVGKIEQWQRKRHAETISGQAGNSKTGATSGKKPKYNRYARLYVGNLHWETTEVELAHYFSVFGDLEDVKIIKDQKTGNSRGFAFVTFSKVSEAEEAKRWCAYNYPMLRGRDIKVTNAERRLPRQRTSSALYHDNSADLSLDAKDINSTLFWEFKWTQDTNAETFGPYQTSVMLRWVKQGYFESGCWVRQVDVHNTIRNYPPQSSLLSEEKTPNTNRLSHVVKKTTSLIDYSDSSNSEDEEGSQDKVGECRETVQGRDGWEGDSHRDSRQMEKDREILHREDRYVVRVTAQKEKEEYIGQVKNELDKDIMERHREMLSQKGIFQGDLPQTLTNKDILVPHQKKILEKEERVCEDNGVKKDVMESTNVGKMQCGASLHLEVGLENGDAARMKMEGVNGEVVKDRKEDGDEEIIVGDVGVCYGINRDLNNKGGEERTRGGHQVNDGVGKDWVDKGTWQGGQIESVVEYDSDDNDDDDDDDDDNDDINISSPYIQRQSGDMSDFVHISEINFAMFP